LKRGIDQWNLDLLDVNPQAYLGINDAMCTSVDAGLAFANSNKRGYQCRRGVFGNWLSGTVGGQNIIASIFW